MMVDASEGISERVSQKCKACSKTIKHTPSQKIWVWGRVNARTSSSLSWS